MLLEQPEDSVFFEFCASRELLQLFQPGAAAFGFKAADFFRVPPLRAPGTHEAGAQ